MKKIVSSLLHIALILALLRNQQDDDNNYNTLLTTSGEEYDVTLGQSYILSLTNPRQYISNSYQQYPHYPIVKNTILSDVFSLRPEDGVYNQQHSVVTMLVDSCECETAATATGASAAWNSCISKEDMVMIDEILSADELLTTQISPLLSHDTELNDAASDSGVSHGSVVSMVTEDSSPPTIDDDDFTSSLVSDDLLLADMLLPVLTNDSFSFPMGGELSQNNLIDDGGIFGNVSNVSTMFGVDDTMMISSGPGSLSRQTSRLSDLFNDQHLLDFIHTEIDPDVVDSLLAEQLDDITNTEPSDWLMPADGGLDDCPPMPREFEWFDENEDQQFANADDDVYNKYKPSDDITLPLATASSSVTRTSKYSMSDDEGYFGTNDTPDRCDEGATGIDKNKLSQTKGQTDGNGDDDIYRTDSDGHISPSTDCVWHNHTYHNTDTRRHHARRPKNNTHQSDNCLLGNMKPSSTIDNDNNCDTPSTVSIGKGSMKQRRGKKIDHVLSRKLKLSEDQIVQLPIDELNTLLESYQLTDQQRISIRNIRRRGKNKMAAHNCRKRKMDTISGLGTLVAKLRQSKQSKYSHMTEIRRRLEEANRRYDALYTQVTELIEQSNRLHGNTTTDLTLYQLANGDFVLRPSYQGNSDVNNEQSSSNSKPQSKL